MRIVLDESETHLTAESVVDAVQKAATLAGERGRMIVEIEVDGIRWSEEDLSAPDAMARKAGELRLQTAHPAELLVEMFAGASEAVREVDAIHREAAKFLQTGDNKQGYARLLEALAVWGAVQTGLTRGLGLGVLSRESLESAGIDVGATMQTLEGCLKTVREALVAQDETALSDCLLYEFPAVTERISTLLASLAREAAKAARATA